MTRLSMVLGLVVAVAVLGACAGIGDSDGGGDTRKVLRVGVDPTYPPVAFEENGRIRGIEADLAHLLEEAEGIRIEYVRLEWEELIPALVENRIDVIMSGMSMTVERQALVRFCQPYMRIGQMSLIRREDEAIFSPGTKILTTTARVGVVDNTTGEIFARRKLAKARILTFDTPDAGIAALRERRIDYFVHDAPTLWWVMTKPTLAKVLFGLYHPLTEEYLAWAVRQEDEELLGRLNKHLLDWKTNGTIRGIIRKWIPPAVPDGR